MAKNYFVYQGLRGKPRLFYKMGDQFFRVTEDGTVAKAPTTGLIAANLRNPKSKMRRPATADDLKTFNVDVGPPKAASGPTPKKDPGKDTPAKKQATSGSVKVKSGDTLSQIAKAKGTSIKAIMAANPSITDPNKIRVGQNIKIPTDIKKTDDPYEGQTKKSMADMGRERRVKAADKITSILKDPKYKKTKMMQGGMANGKSHMYATGGAVKDNLSPGLRALNKTRPDVVKKILGK